MSTAIWVAIIGSGFTFLGTIVTVVWGNKKNAKKTEEQTQLTLYRIDKLEEKVNKHNNLIDRMYKVEDRLNVDEEKLKVANNRIKDLEEELK